MEHLAEIAEALEYARQYHPDIQRSFYTSSLTTETTTERAPFLTQLDDSISRQSCHTNFYLLLRPAYSLPYSILELEFCNASHLRSDLCFLAFVFEAQLDFLYS